jgi:hypothetical protein
VSCCFRNFNYIPGSNPLASLLVYVPYSPNPITTGNPIFPSVHPKSHARPSLFALLHSSYTSHNSLQSVRRRLHRPSYPLERRGEIVTNSHETRDFRRCGKKGKMSSRCRGCCISAASVRLVSIIRSIRIIMTIVQPRQASTLSVHVDNPGCWPEQHLPRPKGQKMAVHHHHYHYNDVNSGED